MADEGLDKQISEDGGQSTWNDFTAKGPYFYPRGALGKWFARFFATPAQSALVADIHNKGSLTGDTKVQSSDVAPESGGMALTVNRASPVYSEIERTRRERYKQYERMDEYPEVGAAFDVYADDCTYFGKTGQVVVLDGLFMAATVRTLRNISLEQPKSFEGAWDFYDIYYTFQAHVKKLKNYTLPIQLRHESYGELAGRDSWHKNRTAFLQRMDKYLPASIK